jgi:hypothetical protein
MANAEKEHCTVSAACPAGLCPAGLAFADVRTPVPPLLRLRPRAPAAVARAKESQAEPHTPTRVRRAVVPAQMLHEEQLWQTYPEADKVHWDNIKQATAKRSRSVSPQGHAGACALNPKNQERKARAVLKIGGVARLEDRRG